MTTIHSLIRTTGLALITVAAVSVFTGCSKKSETPAAPEAATPAITSPELFANPVAGAANTDPSTVIAVVDGIEITQGEFDQELNAAISRMQGRMPPERLAQMRMQMRDQLLDNMITRKVLVSQIEAENIEISEEELNEAIEELTGSLPSGMTLDDMLAQAQTTEEEFKTSITSELQIRKLIETHIGEPEPPSDEEIETFYTENKAQFERPESVSASHILLGTTPEDTEEDKAAKKEQIEEIRAELLEGADFAELAKEHSSCPSSAQGGSLGTFARGQMVPEFEEAAFSQEIDSIGEVVETQFGYHIVKVTERSEAGITPFEEVKEQLSEYLGGQTHQQKVQEYVASLRESADVTFPGSANQSTPAVN